MARAYSVNLISVHSLGGGANYAVPTDKVVVCRDFGAYINTINPEARVWLQDGNTGGTWFSALVPSSEIGVPYSVQWQGRQVFGPGTNFFVATSGDTWDVRLSGYLLDYP